MSPVSVMLCLYLEVEGKYHAYFYLFFYFVSDTITLMLTK